MKIMNTKWAILMGVCILLFSGCMEEVPPETRRPDTSAPISAPVSTSAPVISMEFCAAEEHGLIQAKASGSGLEWIKILLKSLSDSSLKIEIQAGTIFDARSSGTQSMVVRKGKEVYLDPGESLLVEVLAACMDMMLDVPSEDDSFVIRKTSASSDLIKLLKLPEFSKKPFRVQQFAIWTITDNPSTTLDFVGIVEFGYNGWGGPTHDELCTIRAMFEKAGISIEKYPVLKSLTCI